ncbi:MAG TPA: hypothetical protein PLA88_04900 [Bacteroidales bacterium]|nr:hypothetical protein [Bacteroidales bacterium]
MKTNCKKLFLGAVLSFITVVSFAQAGQKWSLTGNASTTTDFLGTTNAMPLVFKTNNTARLTIGPDGVIILNSFSMAPAGILRFDAGGKLQSTPWTNNSNEVLTGDGTFRNIQGMDLGWKVFGTTKIYCEPGFRVGIGTENPAAALDINGNAIIRGTLNVFDGIIIGKSYTGEKAMLDTVMASKMESDEMKASQYKTSTIIIDGNNSRITSQTGEINFDSNSLYAGSLRVTNLQVTGTTTQSNLVVQNHLQIGTSSLHLSSYGPASGTTENRIYSTNGDLLLQSESGSNFNTIINGNNNGYVGIGTTTPQQNLHIKGSTNLSEFQEAEDELSANLSATIRLEDVAYNAPAPLSNLNRTSHWDIAASAGRQGLYFRTDDGLGGNNQHIIMTLKENTGNVGIGTLNPTEKLHVRGDQYPVFMKVQNEIGFAKIGFNGAHGIIESDHGLLLNYYSGQDVIVGGQNSGEGSFYSVHNTYLASNDGQVAIGCSQFDPGALLTVDGKITAEDVEIKILDYPDYVFAKDYKLMTFVELRAYIEMNKHLPNVPSAGQVSEEGLSLSDNSRVQMEKIEELTLYILQLEQRLKELEETVKQQSKQ